MLSTCGVLNLRLAVAGVAKIPTNKNDMPAARRTATTPITATTAQANASQLPELSRPAAIFVKHLKPLAVPPCFGTAETEQGTLPLVEAVGLN
jgi:hypothetical protein